MSDNMVPNEKISRNLWKPARKANVLKGLLAVLLGAVLVSTVLPATAQAAGPTIKISRINGQYNVQGWNWPANAKGTIWAQLGDITGQKDVRTHADGYFWVTFWRFTPAHNGPSQAKVWINGKSASATADLTNTGANTTTGSAGLNDGTGTTNEQQPVTTTTAPPAPVVTTPPTPTTAKPVPTTAKPTTTTTAKPASSGSGSGFTDSAAGWKLAFSDDFNGSSVDTSKWGIYNGTGNAGIGLRRPSAISVANGELRITGHGYTAGGMASNYKSTYGKFEVRGKLDKGTGYNTAVLLWPSSERWPVDGEIDLSEIFDGNVSQMGSFAHWGSNNSQQAHTSKGDFSQWHTYGVEWTSDKVVYFLDGAQIMTVTGAGVPHNAHFLGIQLDVSTNGNKTDGLTFHVDWAKAYTKS